VPCRHVRRLRGEGRGRHSALKRGRRPPGGRAHLLLAADEPQGHSRRAAPYVMLNPRPWALELKGGPARRPSGGVHRPPRLRVPQTPWLTDNGPGICGFNHLNSMGKTAQRAAVGHGCGGCSRFRASTAHPARGRRVGLRNARKGPKVDSEVSAWRGQLTRATASKRLCTQT